MKLVFFQKSEQSCLNNQKILFSLFLLSIMSHLTSNSLLSENQIKISLGSHGKKFSNDSPSLIMTHPKQHLLRESPISRNLRDHSEMEVINNQPKVEGDQYDEVTGQKESLIFKTTTNRCNRQILNNYLISGYDSPKLENHKFCPTITFNCCSEHDQNITMENWNTDFRGKIQKYYSVYINSIRYLLGFHEQFNIVASHVSSNLNDDFVPKPTNSEGEVHQVDPLTQQKLNTQCMETANDFLQFKFDRQLVELLLNRAIKLTNTFTELRSSFFCTLCDGQAQEMLKGFWQGGDNNVKETMFLSKDFCERFVDETIDGSYNFILYLKTYMNYIKIISDCYLGEKTKKFKEPYTNLKYHIPDESAEKSINKCFDHKNDGIIPNCEDYCNQFNLSLINKTIEGDSIQLFKFVDFVSQRRYSLFNNQTNIFTEDPSYLRNQVESDFEGSKDLYMFFNPSHQKKLLDSMKSDIVSLGGINPFDSGNENMYNIILAGVQILTIGISVFAMMIW